MASSTDGSRREADRPRAAWLAVVVCAAVGCRQTPVFVPPAEVAPLADSAATIPPAPTFDPDAAHAELEIEEVVAVPLPVLRRYLDGSDRVAAAMAETERVSRRVEVADVLGCWPEEGAVRRVVHADGEAAFERVLAGGSPTLLRWQAWGFTGDRGSHVTYLVGERELVPIDGETTRLVWRQWLRPNHALKRFFVQRFVDAELKPLIKDALEQVRAEAKAHRPS